MNTEEILQERRMLADSVRRWVASTYTMTERTESSQHPHGCSPQRWSEFAEMGWLGMALPEEDGGLGGSLAEACIVAEELGRALVVEPFVACSVLGSMLLADLAEGAPRRQWLPVLADGRQRVAFAPWDEADVKAGVIATSAIQRDGHWRLDGNKALAPGLAGANGCIVAARTGASRMGLFLINLHEEDGAAQIRNHRLHDGRHAAALHLRGAGAILLSEGQDAEVLRQIERALDRARIADCAETLGALDITFNITREYLLARSQFGRPIATNQTVQHRLVDLYVEIEEVRSLCHVAAVAPQPRLAAALAARTSEVARHTWEEAIQLHGAIGMTEEYALGAYVRRLALATSSYGDVHRHLEQLANLSLGAER